MDSSTIPVCSGGLLTSLSYKQSIYRSCQTTTLDIVVGLQEEECVTHNTIQSRDSSKDTRSCF